MRAILMFGFLGSLFTARATAQPYPEPASLPSHPELPDSLVMHRGGEKITTKDDWFKKRRPELKHFFQNYMYGFYPSVRTTTAKINHEDPKAFGGKATLREIVLTFDDYPKAAINLLLVVPNDRKAPAPVFVGMNFSGNHTLVNDPKIQLPTAWMYGNRPGVKDNKATEEGRGKAIDVWNLEQSIERGYAVATFYSGDIDPDRADERGGIRPFWNKPTEPAPSDTATIMAWSWGIHRAVDHLVTLKELDPKKIICVGHSRLGKTALLAAAFDDRIAIAMPHQAGCGGSAPSRSKSDKAESVKRINTSFPHWFNGNFKQFNDDPTKLPFDQHCLVAICAPRPVLFTNAMEDQWANPDGQFEMLKAAEPVYRLLDAGGCDAKERPPIGKLVNSKLGYFIRDGKHSMIFEDWKVFWEFADKHLGKP